MVLWAPSLSVGASSLVVQKLCADEAIPVYWHVYLHDDTTLHINDQKATYLCVGPRLAEDLLDVERVG